MKYRSLTFQDIADSVGVSGNAIDQWLQIETRKSHFEPQLEAFLNDEEEKVEEEGTEEETEEDLSPLPDEMEEDEYERMTNLAKEGLNAYVRPLDEYAQEYLKLVGKK